MKERTAVDALGAEAGHHLIALETEGVFDQDTVHPVRVDGPVFLHRQGQAGDGGEGVIIASGIAPAHGQVIPSPFHLGEADGGRGVG